MSHRKGDIPIRFISRSTEKNLPFFKVLRKSENFEWNKKCKEDFENLKVYVSSLPLLSKLEEGEPLYIYLTITPDMVSSVMVRIRKNEHLLVYYLSKVLGTVEKNYQEIKKHDYCLVEATRKLKLYFQSHKIVVLTN